MNKYISTKFTLVGRIREKFFRKEEINKISFVDPSVFLALFEQKKIEKNFSDQDFKIYCQTVLQNCFYVILRKYFKISNESFFTVCSDELEVFKIARKQLTNLEWKLPKVPEEALIMLYCNIKSLFKIEAVKELSVIIGEKIESKKIENVWQDKVIKFIENYVTRELKNFVSYFFVHGSFATRDFISNWSDLDTLVFLKEEVFVSPQNLFIFKKKIEKLSLLVYKIDPIAHHEFMFLTEFDRLHYPSFIFPPNLYSYSRDLLKNEKISVFPRMEFNERIFSMMKFIQTFRKKILTQSTSTDDFSWKNDLSLIMLFPSLLLEAKGVEIYKKFSFKKAKEMFPSLDFSVVDDASIFRRDWKRINFLRFIPNFFFIVMSTGFSRKVIGLHRKIFGYKIIGEDELKKRKIMYDKFVSLSEKSIDILFNDVL